MKVKLSRPRSPLAAALRILRLLLIFSLIPIIVSPVSAQKVTAQGEIPIAPSNLQVSIESETRVYLSWTDNSANETGFSIYDNGISIAYVEAEVTSIALDVYPNPSHCFVVNAFNEIGFSEFSNEVCVTPVAPRQLPAAPTNLQATVVNNTQIHLSWIDNSSDEAGFHILEEVSIIATVGSDITSATVGDLEPGEHCFLVTAYNDVGDSYPTNQACATIVNTYSFISGRVTDSSGNPIIDVYLQLTINTVTWTDSEGNYSFGSVGPGTYSITPVHDEYTFSPPSRTVTVPPGATDINFTGTLIQAPTATPSKTPTRVVMPTATATPTRTPAPPVLATPTWTRKPATSTGTLISTPTPTRSAATTTPTKTSTPSQIPNVPVTSALCGQVKLATSKTSSTFFPVLIACGSKDVYLLQPSSFRTNAAYRIYDPVIETIPARSSQDYGEITKEITSWSHIEEIDSCEACGLGPSLVSSLEGETDLQLVNVEVKGSPAAFKPFEVVLTVQNSGFARYEPGSGGYQVQIEFVEDFPYQKTVFVFDSEVAGIDRWLVPKKIPALEPCADSIDELCGEVKITVSDLLYPATYTGSIHVTLLPKDEDVNTRNNTWSDNFPVGPSDESYRHCIGLAIKFLPNEGIMLADPRLTPEFLKMTARVGNCPGGNEACVANESGQFIDSLIESKLLKGTLIGQIKTTIEVLLEGGKCTTWCWNYIRLLNDKLREKKVGINIAVVESPAFILVENKAGQQAGFDDEGGVVQTIPDSYAFIVNEDKVVVYPSDPQAIIRLKGTGSGVMNVRLIWVDNKEPTKAIYYEAVPVTSSTVATVKGDDSRFAMNLDENGDGQNDRVLLPSVSSGRSRANNFLISSNLLLFAAAGLMLLGLLLFFRTAFTRRH